VDETGAGGHGDARESDAETRNEKGEY